MATTDKNGLFDVGLFDLARFDYVYDPSELKEICIDSNIINSINISSIIKKECEN